MRLPALFHRPTTICREGIFYFAIVLLVFGASLIKEVNLLLILAGMMLGPFLLNWRSVRTNLRRLRISRKLPNAVAAGDHLSVALELANERPRLPSWAVLVEEQIRRIDSPDHEKNHSPSFRPTVLFPYVPAGESRKGAYRGRLVERGAYQFGPLKITTRFPFGLFSRTISLDQRDTLLVLPRLGRLTEGWTSRRQESLAGSDRRRRRPGPEGDFYGVRDWRKGDGRRLIHWRGYARRGKLVVRQFERPRTRDVAFILDLWRPEQPTAENLDAVELAVSFTATALADLCRAAGSSVFLTLNDQKFDLFGGPASPALLQAMLKRLATAESGPDDRLSAVLAHILPQISAGTEIVLVGTRKNALTDHRRFANLLADPVLHARLQHIRAIDASSTELLNFFHPE